MIEKATRRDAIISAGAGLLAVSAGPVRVAQAQAASSADGQTSPASPMTFAQVAKPADGVLMPEGYARAIAQFAYLWGWPLVNSANRRRMFNQAPRPGLLGGVVPVAPVGRISMLVDYIDSQEHFVTCPNQDVVYGFGYYALDEQPVVFQVPDFGDRFWVYALYDGRTDQFGKVGKLYSTKPGFYLMAGPNWKGDAPAGIEESYGARPNSPPAARAFS